jgi:non-specific protein-tyrosine kinase
VGYDAEPILLDLIKLVRRGLLLAGLVALVAAAAAFFVSRALPPVHQAQATVVSSAQDPNQRDFGTTLVTAPPLSTASYLVAIGSRPVLADALQVLEGRTPTVDEVDELEEALTVRAEGTTTSALIRLQVRAHEPTRARDMANAVAEAAVRWDQQRATRSLEHIIASLGAQIASIDAELAATTDAPSDGLTRARSDLALQLSSARALRSGAVGRLELLEAADTPRSPVAPRPVRNAVLAALFGVFMTYGLVLLQAALDTRLRSLDDLVLATGMPLLAEFPRVEGGRRKLPTEAASYLRTAVGFATVDAEPKVLMVTSTAAEHGKSSVSMALAESFARQHYRVLLMDADLRKPVLGSEYGLDPERVPSLRDALENPAGAEPIAVALGRELTLDLLPSFRPSPNPSELLANRMRPLLDTLAPRYDVIVIDCAPVLPVADALIVAPHTTGVLFAVSVPDADRRQVIAAVGLLRRLGVRLLGTVATKLPKARDGRRGYGYGYGYGYGHGGEGVEPRTSTELDQGSTGTRRASPSVPDVAAQATSPAPVGRPNRRVRT